MAQNRAKIGRWEKDGKKMGKRWEKDGKESAPRKTIIWYHAGEAITMAQLKPEIAAPHHAIVYRP
jgi:hypothetical protein